MKISWGIKIILAFIVFAMGIGTMVGISMTKNIDLVTENYYEKELKYQDKIDMLNRTKALTDKITIENTSGIVKINFPSAYANEIITGTVNFYRAMDKKKDFKVELKKDASSIQKISTANMEKGNWKVEIMWKMQGKDYFCQSDIFVD